MVHLKNQRALDRLRKCADLVSRTLGEVARYLEPGATTLMLDAVAEDFVRSNNAVPAFKGYKVRGLDPFPGTLCVSVNSEVVHGIPGKYIIREGDVVSVDCGVLKDGYYGDSAYTFMIGDVDPEARALCATTYQALNRGIAAAEEGNRIGDISNAVEVHCAGYGVVRDLVGHGIGRSLHEDPQVPNYGAPRRGRKLKTGLTICIEPMVNMGVAEVQTSSDGWTVCSADGSVSAHYEHMVAVTKSGPEILTSFRYIEEVVQFPHFFTHG